jgi:carbamoyltransferase
MRRFAHEISAGARPQDVAASVQAVLERFVLESVGRLVERHRVRRLGLSGGVFANVRLNRRLAEELGLEEIFVFPAMSDEGLPVGGALDVLLAQDGPEVWTASRRRLRNVYLGRDYGAQIDAALAATPGARRVGDAPVEEAARRIAAGEIGAIYDGGMEFGPRALGARSILASPVDPRINADLNRRLARTDFMPFAPVVLEEDAPTVFELGKASAYAARFMTVTCGVRPEWRTRIPAVVHVDGSARPQTIDRASNPLYADIVSAHRAATGLPVLINTSFNVHEEPIVNRPEECVRALRDGRVDFVVTSRGVWRLD